jgi:hypothetical protein
VSRSALTRARSPAAADERPAETRSCPHACRIRLKTRSPGASDVADLLKIDQAGTRKGRLEGTERARKNRLQSRSRSRTGAEGEGEISESGRLRFNHRVSPTLRNVEDIVLLDEQRHPLRELRRLGDPYFEKRLCIRKSFRRSPARVPTRWILRNRAGRKLRRRKSRQMSAGLREGAAEREDLWQFEGGPRRQGRADWRRLWFYRRQ